MRASLLSLFVLAASLSARDEKEDTRILSLFAKEFIAVTPGKGVFPASFAMGSAGGAKSETPTVKVTFTKPFAMAKYEVTQELYKVVTASDPSRWKGPRNSVEMVSHAEAVAFCEKVTSRLRKAKLIGEKDFVRLPSEAEWEYCCRAGTTTKWSFGDKETDIGDYAWYAKNSKGEDPPVGRKKPNAWGFYDMHGYISEWCSDVWSETHAGANTDGSPRTRGDGKKYTIRGGSFADPADACASAYRTGTAAGTRSDRLGFRCVLMKGE